jgi:hypothetical protein
MVVVFLALSAMLLLQLTARPSDCKALEAVYDGDAADGFPSFNAFLDERIIVKTRLVGLNWMQTVVYPNPQASLAFNRPTATEIVLEQSWLRNTSFYSSLNIPLSELDKDIAKRHVCAD